MRLNTLNLSQFTDTLYHSISSSLIGLDVLENDGAEIGEAALSLTTTIFYSIVGFLTIKNVKLEEDDYRYLSEQLSIIMIIAAVDNISSDELRQLIFNLVSSYLDGSEKPYLNLADYVEADESQQPILKLIK
jgi:hypothetical protein